MKKKYTEELALEILKDWFNKLGRVPSKKDFKNYNIKPGADYYVEHFHGVINACVKLGLIEKPLTVEERIHTSIKELKELAEKINRVPTLNEYERYRNKGYSIFPLQKYLNITYTQICDKYLKEYKDVIPEGYYRCSICKTIKPKNEFYVNYNRESNVSSSCKLCAYLKRNELNIAEGWTREEYLIVIDNIMNEKVEYINDLCDILPSRSLNDFAELLSKYIRIGNKPLNVKFICSNCGKEVIKFLSIYLINENNYCSLECYWDHKKEIIPKGEDNICYKRIKTNCNNCNKEIHVIPYNFDIVNADGENHNFCSQECYWEYRSKYYIGEKHPQFGVKRTKQQRQAQRVRTTKMFADGVFNRLTKPQKIVNQILDELKMKYENEYNCKYYSIDNYLVDYNLMIEVMGDYFHSNPLKFKKINDMQFKDIVRDKSKCTYIKRYKNINILYLWENDINNNEDLIKELILKYINNNGLLDEYNSFNYSLHNEKLIVNDVLIKPYIDWTSKELNEIKKEKLKNIS